MVKGVLKKSLNSLLGTLGLQIVKSKSITTYENIAKDYQTRFRSGEDLVFLMSMPNKAIKKVLELAPLSQSQIRQDLFALAANDFKRKGFFVEFGATDGKSLNNTFLLEKKYDWTGILAEPAVKWHKELFKNRTSKISTQCVWSESGTEVQFAEVTVPELSTVEEYVTCDSHSTNREVHNKYLVETISLNDLLAQYKAPEIIDYLSIDTEGTEFLILSNLDFSKWKFLVITVEHNFSEQRELIHNLLVSNGYVRVCKEASRFDDWYLSQDLAVRFDFD